MLRSSSSSALLQQKAQETTQKYVAPAAKGILATAIGGVGAAVSATALTVARKVYPSYCDPISANIINEDPDYSCNVQAVLIFRNKVTPEQLKVEFGDITNSFERFRQRVVRRNFGWPFWETKDFNIDDHIEVEAKALDREELQNIITANLHTGMDPDKPLWKLLLFTNYTDEGGRECSALIFKYNHVLADGYNIMRVLFTNILDRLREDQPAVLEKLVNDSKSKSANSKGGIQLSKFLPALGKLVLMVDDPPSAIKAEKLLTADGPKVARFGQSKVSVDDIKPVVKAMGKNFTINDALFGCLSSALTKFSESKGAPLKQDLTSVIWVALKPPSNVYLPSSVLPVDEPDNSTLSNVYLKLPRTTDSIESTEQVNERFWSLKGSPEPILAKGLRGGFGVMPKGLTNIIWPALSNKVSLSVSSLPGPTFDFEFCGSQIDNVAFFVPPQGTISFFVTIMTYKGKIMVSMTTDKSVADEQQLTEVVNLFTEEINQFVEKGRALAASGAGALGEDRLKALSTPDGLQTPAAQSKL